MEYKKGADSWWRDNGLFCDFIYSGDSAANTFSARLSLGPSNFTGLTEAQINFSNTNDPTAANFLRINIGSVAESSPAIDIYPDYDLAPYAGWAAAIPEPMACTALVAASALLARRRVPISAT